MWPRVCPAHSQRSHSGRPNIQAHLATGTPSPPGPGCTPCQQQGTDPRSSQPEIPSLATGRCCSPSPSGGPPSQSFNRFQRQGCYGHQLGAPQLYTGVSSSSSRHPQHSLLAFTALCSRDCHQLRRTFSVTPQNRHPAGHGILLLQVLQKRGVRGHTATGEGTVIERGTRPGWACWP